MQVLCTQKSRKFEAKSDEAIFLGYSLNSKAYRVYNLGSNTVMESMHVNFDDNKAAKIKDSENDIYEQLKFKNEGDLSESGYESSDDEVEVFDDLPPTQRVRERRNNLETEFEQVAADETGNIPADEPF